MVKTSPIKVTLQHWLESTVLSLGQLAFWNDALAELGRYSSSPAGTAAARKALPVLAMVTGTAAFWQWNSTLLLAVVMGSGGGVLLYQLLRQRRSALRTLERWLGSPQAPIILSGVGGLATLGLSYGTLLLVQELHSPGLVLLLLLQDVGIVSILGLLLWLALMQSEGQRHGSQHYGSQHPGSKMAEQRRDRFDRCIAGLLQRDELRRLVAVRQLTALAEQGQLSPQQQSQAAEYLALLMARETQGVVQQALGVALKGLQLPDRALLGAESSVTRRVLPRISMSQYERVGQSQVAQPNALEILEPR